MNYEVTIGIPLYNAAPFIRRTMESVLSQTFESIEFLIIDDCSKDKSIEIVTKIKQEHPRGNDIRIISQPHNMGVGPARNRIIDEAQGKYLYFMDSDDLITKQTISLLYTSIKKHDADIAFGSYEKIEIDGEKEKHIPYCYPDMTLLKPDGLGKFAFRKYGGLQASVFNYLVDLSFLRNIGIRFINASYWEDMVFTYQLATYVERAVLHSQITYQYICRKDSLSNYQYRNNIAKSEILRNVQTINYLKKHTNNILNKSYLGNWCYNIVMTDFYIICNILKKKGIIYPEITSAEMRSFMYHPLTIRQIMHLSCSRYKNIFLYLLSIMPTFLSLYIIKLLGKRKGLI